MYVPRSLRFRCDRSDQTPVSLAKEILALTKMNWNNTQFDNSEPITLHAARQVGDILKYLGPTDQPGRSRATPTICERAECERADDP